MDPVLLLHFTQLGVLCEFGANVLRVESNQSDCTFVVFIIVETILCLACGLRYSLGTTKIWFSKCPSYFVYSVYPNIVCSLTKSL